MVLRTTPIIPLKVNMDALLKEFAKGLDDTRKVLYEDFTSVTSTWNPPPRFRTKLHAGGWWKDYSTEVWTTDQRYLWTDQGTKPHIIRPKNAKVLRFRRVFNAKSVPGRLKAYVGASSGRYLYANVVHHPGTKPRRFTELIEKRRQDWYTARMKQAVANAIKVGGHGL